MFKISISVSITVSVMTQLMIPVQNLFLFISYKFEHLGRKNYKENKINDLRILVRRLYEELICVNYFCFFFWSDKYNLLKCYAWMGIDWRGWALCMLPYFSIISIPSAFSPSESFQSYP